MKRRLRFTLFSHVTVVLIMLFKENTVVPLPYKHQFERVFSTLQCGPLYTSVVFQLKSEMVIVMFSSTFFMVKLS